MANKVVEVKLTEVDTVKRLVAELTARAERAEATIQRAKRVLDTFHTAARHVMIGELRAALDSSDPVEAAPKESVCPTCGPTSLERHPRLSVMRCSNCKEHLRSDSALPVDGDTA